MCMKAVRATGSHEAVRTKGVTSQVTTSSSNSNPWYLAIFRNTCNSFSNTAGLVVFLNAPAHWHWSARWDDFTCQFKQHILFYVRLRETWPSDLKYDQAICSILKAQKTCVIAQLCAFEKDITVSWIGITWRHFTQTRSWRWYRRSRWRTIWSSAFSIQARSYGWPQEGTTQRQSCSNRAASRQRSRSLQSLQ